MIENKFHYYEPSNGHGLAHDPFKAIVGPRPIGWISTVAADGVLNLAPYSFFNAFSSVHPQALHTISVVLITHNADSLAKH